MTSEPAVRDVRIGGRRIEVAPHNCFACGSLNAHGLRLELHAAHDRCWVETTLTERFEGWAGIAHGGIVSTILDEVMAWALVDHDIWGVTARMTVEFKRPVPIGRPIRAEGRVRLARRRIVEAEGVILDPRNGTELARAIGTYVGAPEARKAELKARYGFALADAASAATPGEPDGARGDSTAHGEAHG